MKIPSAAVPVILFTQIKQWYFPANPETYEVLRSAGFPMIRFHKNLLPTVHLICKPRGIKARLIPFKEEILDPFLDKVGSKWKSKEYRTVSITATTMTFSSSKELEVSKKAIVNLEAALRRFFTRWGFTFSIDYSELRGKSKLHVNYKFDSNKLPVIPLVEDLETIPTIRFKMGHIRFNLQLGTKYLDFYLEEKGGNSWTKIKTSRCLYSQIGDIRPMLTALTDFVNKDVHNFDNLNE